MALSYKARRRWSLIILLIGLPLYIVVAVTLTDWLRGAWPGMPMMVEFFVFVALGVVWALPLRRVFRGVGQPDPDADAQDR